MNFLNTVVIGVNIYDKVFVYFLYEAFHKLRRTVGLKCEFPLFFLDDLSNCVRYNLWKVEKGKSCWTQSHLEVGIGLLELDLMMVQPLGSLIFPSHVNNDICLFPDSRVSGSHDLGIFEFLGVFGEEGAGKHLIAVEAAVMCADGFHVGELISFKIYEYFQHWNDMKEVVSMIYWELWMISELLNMFC